MTHAKQDNKSKRPVYNSLLNIASIQPSENNKKIAHTLYFSNIIIMLAKGLNICNNYLYPDCISIWKFWKYDVFPKISLHKNCHISTSQPIAFLSDTSIFFFFENALLKYMGQLTLLAMHSVRKNISKSSNVVHISCEIDRLRSTGLNKKPSSVKVFNNIFLCIFEFALFLKFSLPRFQDVKWDYQHFDYHLEFHWLAVKFIFWAQNKWILRKAVVAFEMNLLESYDAPLILWGS